MQLPGWSIDAVSGRYPPGLFALYRGHWCGFAARERIPPCHLSGCKAVKFKDSEVIVRQGRFCLTVKRLGLPGHPLQAPVGGAMTRTIHEHPSCKVLYYRFTDGDVTLLELEAPNAAFEYEY